MSDGSVRRPFNEIRHLRIKIDHFPTREEDITVRVESLKTMPTFIKDGEVDGIMAMCLES